MMLTLTTSNRTTIGRVLAAFVAGLYKDAKDSHGKPFDAAACARTILLANVDLGCMTTVDGDALFGELLDIAADIQAQRREGGAK